MKRVFDVSNPRKSYAGHTVYRILSKVTKKGVQPDVAEEVVVWRRFSDFKKLHKDLSKLYKQVHGEAFPSLPKVTFFDRFDDAVIEKRRKSILNLLNFAAGVPQLAESEHLETFLRGGIYSPTSSSRASSFSSSEGDITELNKPDKVHVTPPAMSKENEPRIQTNEPSQGGYLELGGVWLCKQPSLVEGLDTAGTEDNTTLDSTQSDQTPIFIQRSLSFENNEDNVFTRNAIETSSTSSDSEDEDNTNAENKTSSWLQRAISLCSEGEDIETLASEAENSEFLGELNFPKPFSDTANDEAISDQESNRELFRDKVNSQSSEECEESNLNDACAYNTASSSNTKIVTSTPAKSTPHNEQRSLEQNTSISTKTPYEPCRFLPQNSSFDCSGGDYLLAAANVVRNALSCELDGQYKEAFHLYKKCVSLLLNGVQEEKDSKRRDAVRRKTAQYLLKAEALYTAYIHASKEVAAITTVSPSSPVEDLSIEDTSSHLQLTEFSVIGVIGKVILVEKKADKNTYVIKVLSKTEGHHSRHKSKRAKRQRQLIKAAYSKCPFIVQLHQHCETQTAVFLLLEYARGGLVSDFMLPAARDQKHNKSHSYVHNLKETELNKIRPQTNNPSEPSDLKTSANNDTDKGDGSGNRKKKLLFTALEGNRSDAPSQSSLESCVRVWMAEIVIGVAHLHSHGVTCRDLNPNNLLLSDSGHILLSYFSTWIDVNEEPDLFALELNYCAPELFKMEGVTMTADWWSVGTLFYELLIGETLASNYPWGIRLHTQVDLSGYVSAEAASLIKELLIVTPSERLGHGVNGVENIKSHPFFADIDWTTLDSQCQLSIS